MVNHFFTTYLMYYFWKFRLHSCSLACSKDYSFKVHVPTPIFVFLCYFYVIFSYISILCKFYYLYTMSLLTLINIALFRKKVYIITKILTTKKSRIVRLLQFVILIYIIIIQLQLLIELLLHDMLLKLHLLVLVSFPHLSDELYL
ncbi:hypothetical protein SDC9_169714 [bioreactor metagenome]|uniref:Uncharacterized protein n=1 Tax=bioreactor metagenome TaxID=1076179 RepID=A0A645G628_9ZZZZ